jgi:hypothetical protein
MIRALFRFVGIWVLAGAVVAAVVDGTRSIADSTLVVTPLGQTWFQLHSASLNTLQAVIERYVAPALWDPVVLGVLQLPTALVGAALALVLLLIGRPKRDVFA